MSFILEKFGWMLGLPLTGLVVFVRYAFFAGLAFLPLYLLFRKKAFSYKIQVRYPSKQRMWEEVYHSALSAAVFALVGLLIYCMSEWGWTQLYREVALYGGWYIAFSVVLLLLLHDTYFYWMHRWMHRPGLYELLHAEHHRSHNPTPWAALAFHPLEAFLEIAIVPIVVLVLPLHPLALLIFSSISLVWNVLGHAGFEFFPAHFAEHSFWKWFNTATHHNMHHRRANGNYSLYFNFWDRWMSTNHPDYETYFKSIKTRASEARKVSLYSSKKIQRTMQKNWKFFTLLALTLFLASCTAEDEMPQDDSVEMTEEEALEIIESALIEETEGVAKEAQEVETAAETYALQSNCGLSGDTTYSYTLDRPNASGTYIVNWTWKLICEGNLPSILEFDRSIQGQYQTPRMESDDVATSNWSVNHLLAGDYYLLNGSYSRTGMQETNFQVTKNFDTELEMSIIDLAVDKDTGEILSGTGTFALTGSSSAGTTVEHNGSIEFLGNQEATVNINGTIYTISW